MKYLAVIDIRICSKYAAKPWGKYAHCLDAVSQKMQSLCSVITILGKQGNIPITYDQSVTELFESLENKSRNFDSIFYVYGDEPFLDIELCIKMRENHEKYRADFTFADGYPSGLAPCIIHTRILPFLQNLSEGQNWKSANFLQRNFFFETIKKDINQFSIETEISPIDMRARRISLNYSNKHHATISNRFLELGADTAQKILPLIGERPDILWGYPSYYNLQISSNYPQICTYCPYTSHKNFNANVFMSLEQLNNLLDKIISFSEEAVVSLSYMGEVSLHCDFDQMMKAVLAKPTLHLHLETSGIGWTDLMWQTLLSFDKRRVSLIITLDTHKENIYQQLRGDGFQTAMDFTERALREYRENTWIQSVRQEKLEHELEEFYHYFQKHNEKSQVIIQKYNNFCHSLPDEKPVNIAPLERNVCWALQREITIQVDGEVNICASDIKGNLNIGNAFDEHLESIWNKINHYRLDHSHQKYPKICENCDEYYIFNF